MPRPSGPPFANVAHGVGRLGPAPGREGRTAPRPVIISSRPCWGRQGPIGGHERASQVAQVVAGSHCRRTPSPAGQAPRRRAAGPEQGDCFPGKNGAVGLGRAGVGAQADALAQPDLTAPTFCSGTITGRLKGRRPPAWALGQARRSLSGAWGARAHSRVAPAAAPRAAGQAFVFGADDLSETLATSENCPRIVVKWPETVYDVERTAGQLQIHARHNPIQKGTFRR